MKFMSSCWFPEEVLWKNFCKCISWTLSPFHLYYQMTDSFPGSFLWIYTQKTMKMSCVRPGGGPLLLLLLRFLPLFSHERVFPDPARGSEDRGCRVLHRLWYWAIEIQSTWCLVRGRCVLHIYHEYCHILWGLEYFEFKMNLNYNVSCLEGKVKGCNTTLNASKKLVSSHLFDFCLLQEGVEADPSGRPSTWRNGPSDTGSPPAVSAAPPGHPDFLPQLPGERRLLHHHRVLPGNTDTEEHLNQGEVHFSLIRPQWGKVTRWLETLVGTVCAAGD